MINPELLERRPGRHKSRTSELNLPSATTDLIQDTTRKKIKIVIARATRTLRLRADTVTYDLFSVDGGQKFSRLTNLSSAPSGQPIAEAEPAMMQEVIFQVMREHGLDEKTCVPDPGNPIRRLGDGTAAESLMYPSSKFQGVVFIRTRIYGEETGKNMNVAWSVSNELAPDVEVGPIRRYSHRAREVLKNIAALTGRQ